MSKAGSIFNSHKLVVGCRPACSASTANLSNLKIGKDRVLSETSTGSTDTVCIGTVSNAQQGQRKGLLAFEDVEGQKQAQSQGWKRPLI